MANSYCSVRFKTGEELDAALTAALSVCDEADRACDAAARAEQCSTVLEQAIGDINVALSRIADLQESYMGTAALDGIITTQENYIGGGAE